MHLLVHHNTLYTIVVTTLETQRAPGINTLSQAYKYTGFALNSSPFVEIYEENLDFRRKHRAKAIIGTL